MSPIFLIIGLVFLVSLAVPAWMYWRNYRKYRGARVITCPETGCPAAVELDAARAARSFTFDDAELRLASCSRWPERKDCGQDCLAQIEDSPDGCLAKTMVVNWYRGATCVSCGQEIPEIRWSEHKPALMTPERKTIEWNEVPPERLPGVLATHQPVCWNCHVAQTFRDRFPDRVIDLPAGTRRASSPPEREGGDVLRPS